MPLILKIGTKIKIHSYLSNGIKIFVKKRNKWYCLKFNEYETYLLRKAINYKLNDKNE